MPRKRILEAQRPQDRATQRQKLGTLRELTVQPATRKRYNLATEQFFTFLQSEGKQLPTVKSQLDPLACDYLEHLWSSGAGRGLACDTLAGLQDAQPNLRHHLPGAWRLLKTWHVNEVPNRAPPLPEHLVQAMAGWAFFNSHYSFGISLLVGFYTMLRTGELLALASNALMLHPGQGQVLISLGLTKGGKRQGAAESVILGIATVVGLVKRWKQMAKPTQLLTPPPAKWRALFNQSLEALKLSQLGFRPYSLRRGGATFWFSKHQNLDRILLQGRWSTQKSARIYINEGLAILPSMQIPLADNSIKPFLQVFNSTVHRPLFQTLEPPSGRSGGRGKRAKKPAKKPKKHHTKRQKALFCKLSV